jgi:hypothetical protein
LSRLIFYDGIENSGRFEYSSPVCLQLDLLEVGFNRVIGIDYIIIRAKLEAAKAELNADRAKDLKPTGDSQTEVAILLQDPFR